MMKKVIRNIKNFDRAQTMVEFALVLPILLMLIFGLLEVGRMAFVYMTISTASREAVRYGSATGDVLTINSTNKRFADCSGIRSAAQNVDFLDVFSDANIVITYDHGPGTVWPGATCPVGGTGPSAVSTGDRIKVVVSGEFHPIVNLIPLTARTIALGNPITSSNHHTILSVVDVPLATLTQGPTSNIPTSTTAPFPTSTPNILPTDTSTPGPSPTPGCILTSIKPEIASDYKSINWTVTNLDTTNAVIDKITLQWPAGSGNLDSLKLDNNPIPIGVSPPPLAVITPPGGSSLTPGSHIFNMQFANNPLSGSFVISVSFTNPHCLAQSGGLTIYPVTHSGYFPDAVNNSYTTGNWTLTNHTGVPLAVASIMVTWPCGGNNDLNSVTIGSKTWTGSGYISSCTGTIITPINFTVPNNSSNMKLLFNKKNTIDISVQITFQCWTGNIPCQTVNSDDPFQITPP